MLRFRLPNQSSHQEGTARYKGPSPDTWSLKSPGPRTSRGSFYVATSPGGCRLFLAVTKVPHHAEIGMIMFCGQLVGRCGTVTVAKCDYLAPQTTARKACQKPTLAKAAMLSAVAAAPTLSKSFCWVARMAFGEADIRGMIFRSWLLEDAPVWFRRFYARYGELVGSWLAGQESARVAVRALMMPAVNRKLRGWQQSL